MNSKKRSNQLTTIDLHGFKSIRRLANFQLSRINVLIGANGAGKSNFVSFFKLLNWMSPSPGNLQFFVGKSGGASSLLFDGPSVTPQLQAQLRFETDAGTNEYFMRLFHGAQDTLVFAEEKLRFSDRSLPGQAEWRILGSGHVETKLINAAATGDKTARVIQGLIKNCVVYQFHNTSDTARIRQKWSLDDDYFLKEDGANLAPFLLRLRENHPKAYLRIVEVIRQITPYFADFVLEPENGSVILRWRERETDLIFGCHQASDGTLRTMALVALLLQPEENLPDLIILDEPELGLNPYAITIIAGLLRAVSIHSQVILATQSAMLVDHFDPEDIVVIDRPKRETIFTRLDREKLKAWLDEYSLSELWEKNVIGGRPK